MPKYTAEEIATLVVMRSAGNTYQEISDVIFQKFGNSRKPNPLRVKYESIVSTKDSVKDKITKNLKVQTISSEKNWRGENATRRQLRTLAALSSPESSLSERMILADSFEQKGMTKGEASDLIQLNMNKEEPKEEKPKQVVLTPKKPKQNKKKRHYGRWTPAQKILLFQLRSSDKKWNEIAEVLGRTEKACVLKRSEMQKMGVWDEMKQAQKKAKTEKYDQSIPEPTAIEAFVEKHGNPRTRHISKDEKEMLLKIDEKLSKQIERELEESYEPSWSHSQDMQILVNFYEMSIDEVRDAFARPYWVVAQRLEMLFDSSEPEHIAMLVEASDIVMKRKSPRTEKPQKPSRKERRAAKKANKRAAKVARLEAKLEQKLNRLRGE